jgi:hypothetical protein
MTLGIIALSIITLELIFKGAMTLITMTKHLRNKVSTEWSNLAYLLCIVMLSVVLPSSIILSLKITVSEHFSD